MRIGWESLWSDIRTSLATSTFFFDRSLTRIWWESFVERCWMDFFANFHILLRSIFDAHLLGKFCGAIFDGLLRQLSHSSSINHWRASVWKFSWSDLRWTSSPTSTFLFDRSLTCICWEIFVKRSSVDFFANFHILLWSICGAHRLGNGPLHHHPHSSSINLGRASVDKSFVERSSMEFSANSYILLRSIFDAHRLGNFVEWY